VIKIPKKQWKSSQRGLQDFSIEINPKKKKEVSYSKNIKNRRVHRISGFTSTNPLELARYLSDIVCKNSERKYYRFRGGRFYGGIAGADCVGCMLDCAFCWSYKPRCDPKGAGKFYSAKHVAEKLTEIAKKNNYDKVRITGNEPTLCREHLLGVLEYIPEDLLFILESNGVLLDRDYVQKLKPFKHRLHVRVSLKGVTEEQFKLITCMDGMYVQSQYNALKYLTEAGISCNAAIMNELVDDDNMRLLFTRLDEIDNRLVRDLELESLMMYPFIKAELTRRSLSKSFKPL
jgi:uncharacterized Fe-S cluster-containing radical SAM superfamily protein